MQCFLSASQPKAGRVSPSVNHHDIKQSHSRRLWLCCSRLPVPWRRGLGNISPLAQSHSNGRDESDNLHETILPRLANAVGSSVSIAGPICPACHSLLSGWRILSSPYAFEIRAHSRSQPGPSAPPSGRTGLKRSQLDVAKRGVRSKATSNRMTACHRSNIWLANCRLRGAAGPEWLVPAEQDSRPVPVTCTCSYIVHGGTQWGHFPRSTRLESPLALDEGDVACPGETVELLRTMLWPLPRG